MHLKDHFEEEYLKYCSHYTKSKMSHKKTWNRIFCLTIFQRTSVAFYFNLKNIKI